MFLDAKYTDSVGQTQLYPLHYFFGAQLFYPHLDLNFFLTLILPLVLRSIGRRVSEASEQADQVIATISIWFCPFYHQPLANWSSTYDWGACLPFSNYLIIWTLAKSRYMIAKSWKVLVRYGDLDLPYYLCIDHGTLLFVLLHIDRVIVIVCLRCASWHYLVQV